MNADAEAEKGKRLQGSTDADAEKGIGMKKSEDADAEKVVTSRVPASLILAPLLLVALYSSMEDSLATQYCVGTK